MLIEFTVKNYRSFRDEATLSMEATGASTLKSVLIPYGGMRILPGAAIYGKNGGGKSNVIRAFWLAVQFIRNAQKTQHEKAAIPVVPFALNDYSASEPTEFSFVYTLDGIRYTSLCAFFLPYFVIINKSICCFLLTMELTMQNTVGKIKVFDRPH